MKPLSAETFFGASNFGMSDENFRGAADYDQACYIWAKQIYDENSVSYSEWSILYSEIYVDNIILEQIGAAEGEADHRKRVVAEARVRRVLSYMYLMELYARQYDETTAATDLGVPLRLDADVENKKLTRASVKTVYDFMETELSESVEDLPEEAPNKFRLSKASGYAIQARLYLMMCKYEEARVCADKALALNDFVYDYNSVVVTGGYVRRVQATANDENYLIRYHQFVAWGGYDVSVSRELYDLFPHDGTDLREEYEIVVEDQDAVLDSVYFQKMMVTNVAPTVPEMLLIRAEGYARKGDAVSLQKAMEDIEHLRSCRVKTGTPALQANTKQEAMKIILEERRREVNILGVLNWLDMKRLNKEPEYARKVTRVVDGKTYTLEPNSNNYVFPIPYDVLGYNKDMPDNPRD